MKTIKSNNLGAFNVKSQQPTDKPFLKDSVSVRLSDIRQGLEKMAEAKCLSISESFNQFVTNLESIASKRFVVMTNFPVWYDSEVAGIYPLKPGTWGGSSWWGRDVVDAARENCIFKIDKLQLDFIVPTEVELKKSFSKHTDMPIAHTAESIIIGEKSCTDILCCSNCYKTFENRDYIYQPDRDETHNYITLMITIGRFNGADSDAFTSGESIAAWMKYGLIPKGLTYEDEQLYKEWLEHYGELEGYLHPDNNGKLIFDGKKLLQDFRDGTFKGEILGFDFDLKKRIENIKNGKEELQDFTYFKNMLLETDYLRANLAPYAEKQVTDINVGHWDLFYENSNEEKVTITVPKNERIVARPPQLDVVEGGICGIDFGTKSTVVACRQQEAILLRIGKGDFGKAPVLEDYENPTVIQLRDIKKFLKAYKEQQGRPNTRWEQLTVSHQAADAIFSDKDDSDIYYTVFSELKQWANDKNRRLLLKDLKGQTIEVKPYLELKEDEFDPIEIYAYYLGLYINNMYNHIYLDYILSFPVNYAKEVREHLLRSFEKGLKKALPVAILQDSELMENFRVYAGASEPAAYAISALQEYNLQPKTADEKTCYGVFDFGGGTTDFDFGIMSVPKERRKNRYQIEQFGNGGDVYLGGENILDLLAYEVYKDNLEEMRENSIPFVLPPQAKGFAGAETLVYDRKSASQQAYLNCKRIAKELRPLWERHTDYQKRFINNQFEVTLFTNKTKEKANTVSVKLKVDLNKLEQCIKDRIEQGVVNFFIKLKDAFRLTECTLPICIFLAGNSSRHPYVKELFENYIAQEEKNVAQNIKRKNGVEKSTENNCFKLYMPLGMDKLTQVKENVISNQNLKQPCNTDKMKKINELTKLIAIKQGYCNTRGHDQNWRQVQQEIVALKQELTALQKNKLQNETNIPSGKPDIPSGKPKISLDKPITGIAASRDYNRLYTGKTGVVFGLLRSRKGGKDVKIINRNDSASGEAKFPFFLGDIDENNNFHVVIGQGVDYNVWAEFTYADEEDFELSYTTEPKALEGNLEESDVKTLHCRIKSNEVQDDDEVKIFIRKVAPDKIEYAVGKKDDFMQGFKGKTYVKLLSI